MNTDEARERIARELAAAYAAHASGNPGMARVCARRAAGIAITHWLEDNPRAGWGADALRRLHAVGSARDIPPEVQNAARRLTARVRADFTSPSATDPIDDATTIIEFFIAGNNTEEKP